MDTVPIEKKIGRLMVLGFEGKKVPDEFIKLIQTYHIGGVILFRRNIGSPHELLNLTAELQRIAKDAGYDYPLLICLDQENGMVRRLEKGATEFPGSMVVGATKEYKNAYKIGYATAMELKELGINWNLAPVLDINSNPLNPVIGVRSFGEESEKVAEFGCAMMRGMQDAGVITALKHFPGHGNTNVDSHVNLPIISRSIEQLEEMELIPFAHCIDNGADVVMTAHVHFPAIEDKENYPATLSKNVITKLLREQMDFDGVVTTDCMEMNAIANGIGTEKGVVEAIKAGADLVMVSHTFEKQVNSIKEIIKAVREGNIHESRIDASLQRLNKMNEKYLSWKDTVTEPSLLTNFESVGSFEHIELAKSVYCQGITIVKDVREILPIKMNKNSVLAIYPKNGETLVVEDKVSTSTTLGEIILKTDPNATCISIGNPPTEKEIILILDKARVFDRLIIGTLNVIQGDWQEKLVKQLLDINPNTICIGLRNPYDLNFYPEVSTYICTYELTKGAMETAVGAIYGREKVHGSLPVSLWEKVNRDRRAFDETRYR